MTRLRALALLIAAVLLLAGCRFNGAYDLPLPGKIVKDSNGYRVTAEFNEVGDVVPYTYVMANDVPIGQVDSVERVGWHAEVTMTIRNDIVLPANAVADVRQTGLLGEKYVALELPVGVAAKGRLADGATIPLSATTRTPQVDEVLGALSSILSGGGVGQLKTISTELNKAMGGREGDIRSVIVRVDALVTSLDRQKSNIIDALAALDHLTATLNKNRTTIAQALDSFGPALQVLNEQHADLIRMLSALDRLGQTGTHVIQQTRENLVADLAGLAPTLRELADAGDSLPKGLVMMASFPFPKQAATLAKGDYSNALFHMNFDLNKALSAALKGGDSGLPNISQLCAIYGGASNCSQLMGALCTITKVAQFCAPMTTILPGGSSNGGTGGTQPPKTPLSGILGPVTGSLLPPSLTQPGSVLGPDSPLGGLL